MTTGTSETGTVGNNGPMDPQNRGRPGRRAGALLAGAGLVVAACLLVSEAALRLAWHNPYAGVRHRVVRLWEPPPNQDITYSWPWGDVRYRTDHRGYIEPAPAPGSREVLVAFLGGSTTECMAVPEKRRFAHLAAERLSEMTGLRVGALNHGVCGANSQHSLSALVNKIGFAKPDVCVLMHGINDLGVLTRHASYAPFGVIEPERFTIAETLKWLSARLHLFGLLRRARMAWQQKRYWHKALDSQNRLPEADCRQVVAGYGRNLRTFVALCRVWGITPVLMTQCHRPSHGVPASGQRDFARSVGIGSLACLERMNQAVRDLCRELEVVLIDLEKAVPFDKQHLYDGIHFHRKGSERAAEVISGGLLALPVFQHPRSGAR